LGAKSPDGPAIQAAMAEPAFQIKHQSVSTNASSLGDGRHLRGASEASAVRLQKASRTSKRRHPPGGAQRRNCGATRAV
jgi:hypothetical protein